MLMLPEFRVSIENLRQSGSLPSGKFLDSIPKRFEIDCSHEFPSVAIKRNLVISFTSTDRSGDLPSPSDSDLCGFVPNRGEGKLERVVNIAVYELQCEVCREPGQFFLVQTTEYR